MQQPKGHGENANPPANFLAQAIFVVNKHAKTAPEPKYLYNLKRTALNKMLGEGKAQKMGLHFSDNPRFSAQQSDVIIRCGDFTFHLPPTREDLKTLPHMGSREVNVRNPKASLSLSRAKKILQDYVGNPEGVKKDKQEQNKKQHAKSRRSHSFENTFPSSFLGKGFKY
ncbi:YkyB family protein [Peribacillus glennii]|uniref:YkyB-like protein n=1 Tax=Peribacillus glennii TaxID=2303991 RepID=A0A372LCP2_9BACI|nr:YkyB family protein [Peribacillus glennii]RFU63458.1 hypothetical protein D0466_12055 [Peribacillus glennii]